MAEHGLGPYAIEIKDRDMASAFVLVGNLIYIAQPAQGHRDTVFLTRSAAAQLAQIILDGLARNAG